MRVNPLHFMHRPHFRNPVRRRRLRILNSLIWVLSSEGFSLRADDKDPVVELRGHRTKFIVNEGTERPQRAVSETWRKLSGQLSCRIDTKLPDDIAFEWVDSPRAPLETMIPEILRASWFGRNTDDAKGHRRVETSGPLVRRATIP